jgi:hypothetical protein
VFSNSGVPRTFEEVLSRCGEPLSTGEGDIVVVNLICRHVGAISYTETKLIDTDSPCTMPAP